jgi:hypothetical protein
MRRFLRYLRIAFSAACLIACVLLIVLWVRSYWWRDMAAPVMTSRIPSVLNGKLVYNDVRARPSGYPPDPFVNCYLPQGVTFSYNGFTINPTGTVIAAWVLIGPVVAIGVLPWIRWRYSLRALLIATTLVALVLGLVAWATRQ